MLSYRNNAQSTLAQALDALGSDFESVSMVLAVGGGAVFGDFPAQQRMRLTLSHDSAPDAHEIIEAFGRNGDSLTVYRGLEGTTVRAWPVGTQVANYLTAGGANRFVQAGADAYSGMQGGFAVGATEFIEAGSVRKVADMAQETVGPAGSLVGFSMGGSYSLGVILKTGKTSGNSSGDVNSLWGNVRMAQVTPEYASTGMAVGTLVAAQESGMATGYKASAASNSVALGLNAVAVRQSTAVGSDVAALGERSLALGASALALGDGAVALGSNAYQAADYSWGFAGVPTVPRDGRPSDGNSENAWLNSGAEGVIASRFHDLGVAPLFSGQSVQDGDVVRPTSGAVRYRALIPYDPRDNNNTYYPPSVSLPTSGMMNVAMDPDNSNEAMWVAHEAGNQLRSDQAKVGAQVYSQLISSAYNIVNTSASMSASGSYSWNYSGEAAPL